MAPDYDHLTLMEKVEVFEHAVNNTAGDDLAKLLWLKSPSSEVRSLIYHEPLSTFHTADYLYNHYTCQKLCGVSHLTLCDLNIGSAKFDIVLLPNPHPILFRVVQSDHYCP